MLTNIKYLFQPMPYPAVEYREANVDDYAQILDVFRQLDITERIISIHQPVGSAEISSQNFTITTTERILQLRRCHKFKGSEKYSLLKEMISTLASEGVQVPDFEYPAKMPSTESPYFELTHHINSTSVNTAGWVFFKHIDAVSYFPGLEKLSQTAFQVGKFHHSLKEKYGTRQIIPLESDSPYSNQIGPYFPGIKWIEYQQKIQANGVDCYGQMFLDNQQSISTAIKFVEENYHLLQCEEDLQNIHFDLTALNFLMDKSKKIIIIDLDEVKIGNVYTDITMLWARLFTVCLARGQIEMSKIANAMLDFFENYKKGNPTLNLDMNKFIVAAYDRALCNVHASLRFKYDEGDVEWLPSIALNLNRLEQIKYLVNVIIDNQLAKQIELEPKPQLSNNNLWSRPINQENVVDKSLLSVSEKNVSSTV